MSDAKKYSLRDMAKYFAPADRELIHSYGIMDQTYWLSLGHCAAPTKNSEVITNGGKRIELVLTGTYTVNASPAPEVYFQIGSYKSSVATLSKDAATKTFTLKCTVPSTAVLNEKQIYLKADNVRDGSVLMVSMTLSAYEMIESSQTPPTTVTGCLTTIADWIRKQN